MKHFKYITFWLLLALSTTAIVFTSCTDDEDDLIAVTAISLDATTLSLEADCSYTLTATVSPADASDKTITWTSSDITVATVADGKIIAVAVGTATITATAGTITATCTVTVTPATIAVTGISLDTSSLNYLVGETPVSTTTLVATVTPGDATDNTVTWTSSNTSVATVSTTGELTLTATAAGTAIITAQAGTKTATCSITVSALQTSGPVTINGVSWAACNINTPGTFTSSPTDYGYFYQWNSNVGWPSTGDIGSITATDGTTTTWNRYWNGGFTTASSSDTWATASDPSPSGYRVPTSAEIDALLNTTYVTITWTTLNGVYGEKFTDNTTGNIIFLPASGFRSYGYGTLYHAGSRGYYWSSSADSSSDIYNLYFISSLANKVYNSRAYGFAVRPVSE